MAIDIFESRRTYFEFVEYWKRDINASIPTSEIVSEKHSGVFYAKEVNSENSVNEIVGGAFMFDDHNVMLKTNDDISDMNQNDVCRYDGRLWNVVSIQRRKRIKKSALSNVPSYITYIQLRN